MKLYLVQHGQAMDKTDNPERPLSEAGVAEVGALATFLSGKGLAVPELYHSSKVRARQTAERLLTSLANEPTITVRADLDPKDDVAAFARELGEREADLMVVGHLPFLSKLASQLILARTKREVVAFRHAGAVCLERNPNGDWRLNWALPPDLITC